MTQQSVYLTTQGYQQLGGAAIAFGAMMLSLDLTEQQKFKVMETREQVFAQIKEIYGLSEPVLIDDEPRLIVNNGSYRGKYE